MYNTIYRMALCSRWTINHHVWTTVKGDTYGIMQRDTRMASPYLGAKKLNVEDGIARWTKRLS